MLYFNSNTQKDQCILYNKVFKIKSNMDKFVIVTGYVGPQMVNELKKLPYKEIILIIGMYGKSIDSKLHLSLLKSYNEIDNLKIFYTNTLVHTKCYAWYKDNKVKEMLIGSANFSTSGLLENPYKEILYEINDINNDSSWNAYLKHIFNNMYECNKLQYDNMATIKVAEIKKDYKVDINSNTCILSLLANANGRGENIIGIGNKAGEVHASSGLNWGYSVGSPSLGDAYIAIASKSIEETSIIPSKSKGENKPVEVIWDDGTVMNLLFEANGPIRDGMLYPKQISSYNNKKELGDYLRKRIGEKIGLDLIFTKESIEELRRLKSRNKGIKNKEYLVKAIRQNEKLYKELAYKMIKNEHLDLYGRTDITVSLISEGVYYFDFSTSIK